MGFDWTVISGTNPSFLHCNMKSLAGWSWEYKTYRLTMISMASFFRLFACSADTLDENVTRVNSFKRDQNWNSSFHSSSTAVLISRKKMAGNLRKASSFWNLYKESLTLIQILKTHPTDLYRFAADAAHHSGSWSDGAFDLEYGRALVEVGAKVLESKFNIFSS